VALDDFGSGQSNLKTAEQVEIINRLDCSTMQGYFFAKPMPQSEVETFIANCHISDDPRMAAAMSSRRHP
jgi:EAL domain-containing protein (putative c-di-GMP-specific phosphodiesterase class I)